MSREGLSRWVANFLTEASNGLVLLTLVVLAQALGPRVYGEFAFLFTAATLVTDLLALGMAPYVQRETARSGLEAAATVWCAVRTQLFTMLLAVVLVGAITVAIAPGEGLLLPGVLLGVAMAIRSIKVTIRHAWRGLRFFKLEALSTWVERGLLFVVTTVILVMGGELLAVVMVFFGVRVLDGLATFAVARRVVPPSGHDRNELSSRQLIVRVAPLALIVIMWTIYYQVDVLMLAALSTPEQVGIYHASYRFVDLAQAIARVLTMALAPALSTLFVSDVAGFRRLASRVLAVGWAFAMILVIAGPPSADFMVRMVFGSAYAEGGKILAVLLVGAGLSAASFPLTVVLVAANKEKRLALALSVTATLNVVTNIVLIPTYGGLGAAWATVLSEITLASALFVLAVMAGVRTFQRLGWIIGTGMVATILVYTIPYGLFLGIFLYVIVVTGVLLPDFREGLKSLGEG